MTGVGTQDSEREEGRERPYPDAKDVEIPQALVEKWQRVVDTAADIFTVPAGLIMRIDPPRIEVFQTSQNPENPYDVGDAEDLYGLYCEEVITTGDGLEVPDSQASDRWRDNPDVEAFGLCSYLGYPIEWPDGDVFGTICVLDNQKRSFTDPYQELLEQYREMIEADLQVLHQQRALAEQKAALAKRNKQLEVVNTMLSHDIRNDMGIIVGWADHLEREITDPALTPIINRISTQGTHVLELTQAARDLVTAIESNWELERHPIDLTAMLREQVTLVREQHPDAHIDSTIPDGVDVMGNPLFRSVLDNLLTNAIRHNDTETPSITVVLEGSSDCVTVQITDNGPGIPADIQDGLYTMGVSGPESSGSGLGLYLAKSIVDAIDGQITVTDNDPRGTRFTITLPTAASADAHAH